MPTHAHAHAHAHTHTHTHLHAGVLQQGDGSTARMGGSHWRGYGGPADGAVAHACGEN